MAKQSKTHETDEALLARTIAAREKEEAAEQKDVIMSALLALRHAADAAVAPHQRSPRYRDAIATADKLLESHYNSQTTEDPS